MASTSSPIGVSQRPIPQLEGVTHRFVDAGGLRMHVAEAGEPSAPALLLLHGWPQHWYMWRKQIPTLAQEFRIVAPDLRGMGWSDAPSSGYEKETIAGDVIALLDALELDQVSMIGHDWGGWIGYLFAYRQPERCRRYLALNIPQPWGGVSARKAVSMVKFWYQWVNASPWLGQRAVQPGSRWLRGIMPPERTDIWDPVARESFEAQFAEPARAHASQLYYRTFITREFLAAARGHYARGRLEVPTRTLFGTNDFAIPTVLLEADHSRYADDYSVELVEGCGHFIAEEQPVLVTNRALEFLGGD